MPVKDKFSVLMAVYQKERPTYLAQSLQSLVVQTLRANEIVLVEDGPISTELAAVIESYRSRLNIISVPLKNNVGLAVALNEGLKFCRYELVARMDSDDICLPERFERQVAWMNAHPEVAASSCCILEFDDSGDNVSKRVLPSEHEQLVKFAKRRSPLSHPAVIFRNEAVTAVGGYPSFRKGQDYALWSVLIMRGYRLGNSPEVLLKMRMGSDMLRRRGFSFLKREVALLGFQRRIGFINFFEYWFNLSVRAIIRLAPTWFRRLLYRFARNFCAIVGLLF